MEIINSKVTEDQVVTTDTQYNDLLAENITVMKGITTRVYGIIKKKLIVEKNAVVYLHGNAPGEIINNGGVIYLFGPSGEVTNL